jgi:hypothetical protein
MRKMPLTVMSVKNWRFEKSFCGITGILVDCVGSGNIAVLTDVVFLGTHMGTVCRHGLNIAYTLSTLMATTWSWVEKYLSSGCLDQHRGRCCSVDFALMVSWFSNVGCCLFLESGVLNYASHWNY